MFKNNDIKIARKKLETEGFACVVVRNGETIFTSRDRGIAPLVEFKGLSDAVGGYSLADKVIGKAAALLCVHSHIGFVYAAVISSPARRILEKNKIHVTFKTEVPAIKNRAGDGPCPMEKLSEGVDDPKAMFMKVVEWMDSLQKGD